MMGSWCKWSYRYAEHGFPPLTGHFIDVDTDRKDELAKRAIIFNATSALATMFSGYLMTAVIHLNGRHGFQGWQW